MNLSKIRPILTTFVPAAALCILLGACASARVSELPTAIRAAVPVRVIALAPGGGLLADAVGVELSNRGFTVIDPQTVSQMMVRMNMSEVEITKPEALTKLKAKGIDAYLTVRSAAGYDGLPQSASARLNSTSTGRVLAGVSWQNGWGGKRGSPADRIMRDGLADAAKEIADALTKHLRP